MAVEVPKAEKVYTKVYENFKGVDFTDDPSNVFYRRSPDGLNMLPDLDGRPYKRYGWKIEIPASEFGTNVKPDRLYHFSLNGLEYIMIFNNKGVFYMKTGQDGVVKCQLKEGNLIFNFPPQVGGENVPADSNRSFYFEGAGLSGFYTFVGNELYRFDGEYYRAVAPYIPTVIQAADHTGVGTDDEDINLLTEFRAITYRGDGNTEYSIPEIPDSNTIKVEVYDTTVFDWETLVKNTDYTVQNNIVSFTTAPPTIDEGVNIRITYKPNGSGTIYAVDSNYVTDEVTITATRVETSVRKKTVKKYTYKSNSSSGLRPDSETTTEDWPLYPNTITDNSTSEEISVANCFDTDSIIVQDNITGTWTSNSERVVSLKTPYNDTMSVSAMSDTNPVGLGSTSNSVARNYGTPVTKIYEWVQSGKPTVKKTSTKTTTTTKYTQTKTVTYIKTFKVKIAYHRFEVTGSTSYSNNTRTALMTCRKASNFGNGSYNQMFLSAASEPNYQTRAWFCAKNDPSYFPDLNYIEVGSDDTEVVGMIKIGSYLGFVKAGSGTETSVYLAYPITFDERDTFAVKQGVNGIGAVSNGAFNVLEGEPLFLSKDGVIGIEVSDEETDRHARNRSWFLNGKLCKEKLSSAVSYIFDGMYWLAVDGHCYVLDGSQKNSWANEKTNLQYEGYYLDNIPAICFASMDNRLYFTDNDGNICRFRDDKDAMTFRDDYALSEYDYIKSVIKTPLWRININTLDIIYINDFDEAPEDGAVLGERAFSLSSLDEVPAVQWYDTSQLIPGKTVLVGVNGGEFGIYTLASADVANNEYKLSKGVPIKAVWSTIADDDGAVHFFKNLQKKGCVVSLLPMAVTGATVSLKADEKEPVTIGQVEFNGGTLPHEFYIKKKLKKYKRLQIICENNDPDSGFGLDQIIKSYTMGNYSKNKG